MFDMQGTRLHPAPFKGKKSFHYNHHIKHIQCKLAHYSSQVHDKCGRIFHVIFPLVRKPCHCRTVDNSMVSRPAHVYDVNGDNFIFLVETRHFLHRTKHRSRISALHILIRSGFHQSHWIFKNNLATPPHHGAVTTWWPATELQRIIRNALSMHSRCNNNLQMITTSGKLWL